MGRFGGTQVPDDEDRDGPQHVGAPNVLDTAGSGMLTGGLQPRSNEYRG